MSSLKLHFRQWLEQQSKGYGIGDTVKVLRGSGGFEDWQVGKVLVGSKGEPAYYVFKPSTGENKTVSGDKLDKWQTTQTPQGQAPQGQTPQGQAPQGQPQGQVQFEGPVRTSGRDIVVVEVPGRGRTAFYRSTGINSGRTDQWFPFDGVSYRPGMVWFDKEDYHVGGERYGNDPALKQVGMTLGTMNIGQGKSMNSYEINDFINTPKSKKTNVTLKKIMGDDDGGPKNAYVQDRIDKQYKQTGALAGNAISDEEWKQRKAAAVPGIR
jgi:hypothetical protein